MSKISPVPKTTSKPNIFALKGPYLIKYFPPAYVAMFPPIRQDPLFEKKKKIFFFTFFF
jgi:hypothetical protein